MEEEIISPQAIGVWAEAGRIKAKAAKIKTGSEILSIRSICYAELSVVSAEFPEFRNSPYYTESRFNSLIALAIFASSQPNLNAI